MVDMVTGNFVFKQRDCVVINHLHILIQMPLSEYAALKMKGVYFIYIICV